MKFDLEKAVEQIKNNKDFLKLKNIIENNSHHNHEPVYDHLIKTYNIAKREINGEFITNKNAKDSFDQYLNQEIDGVKKKDLMLIFALIHDIGKLIIFEKEGKKVSIMQSDEDGITQARYHEYFGSLIVKEIVGNIITSEKIINYLSNCVRLHGLFSETWVNNKDKSSEEILEILKFASENIHVEQIFNGYCDGFTSVPFQPAIPIIHELLNDPKTYEPVKYSIMY